MKQQVREEVSFADLSYIGKNSFGQISGKLPRGHQLNNDYSMVANDIQSLHPYA
jgi:hypothetical protein